MTKNNDFELKNGSNDFFSMISGREYFKQTYDILMDSDKFGKDDLFNFLMNFPNFIPILFLKFEVSMFVLFK